MNLFAPNPGTGSACPIARAQTQRGLSLVELMMALTLGMMLMAGISALFSTTVGANGDALRQMRTTQELRTASDLMTSELRRAGYWSGVATAALGTTIPYGLNSANPTHPTCVLYSYEDTASLLHYRGFRLNNNAIEWLRAPDTTNFDCASTATQWEAITDNSVVAVTKLQFTDRSTCTALHYYPTPNSNCNPCTTATPAYTPWVAGDVIMHSRHVAIDLAGRSARGNSQGVFNLNESVAVRNEEYGTAIGAGPTAGTGCGEQIPMTVRAG